MSVPTHVIPRQARAAKAEKDRALQGRQLLIGRYLDPWGSPEIVWCHSHTIVRGHKVIINVYDLLPRKLNSFLSAVGVGGAFHSGIEVNGTEYAFGGHPDEDQGITVLKRPLFILRQEAVERLQQGEDHDGTAEAALEWMPALRSRTVVGWWMGPLAAIEDLLRHLRFEKLWTGPNYRLLSRNCNHFALAMCAALLAAPFFKPAPGVSSPDRMLPRSVTRLTRLVLALSCFAPCIRRRFDGPLPLPSHSLNVFHGQARKAVASGRNRNSTMAGGTSQPAAAPSGLRGVSWTGRRGGVAVLMAAASAAASAAEAAPAAAATLTPPRQRLEGRYSSCSRVEPSAAAAAAAAPPPPPVAPLHLALARVNRPTSRRTEDGSGNVDESSGEGSTSDGGSRCSTPNLALVRPGAVPGGAAGARRTSNAQGEPTAATMIAAQDPSSSSSLTSVTTPSGVAMAPTTAAAVSPVGIECQRPSISLPNETMVQQAASPVRMPSSQSHGQVHSQVHNRFMASSRSGRRVFPDPRLTPDSAVDTIPDLLPTNSVSSGPRGRNSLSASTVEEAWDVGIGTGPIASSHFGAGGGMRPLFGGPLERFDENEEGSPPSPMSPRSPLSPQQQQHQFQHIIDHQDQQQQHHRQHQQQQQQRSQSQRRATAGDEGVGSSALQAMLPRTVKRISGNGTASAAPSVVTSQPLRGSNTPRTSTGSLPPPLAPVPSPSATTIPAATNTTTPTVATPPAATIRRQTSTSAGVQQQPAAAQSTPMMSPRTARANTADGFGLELSAIASAAAASSATTSASQLLGSPRPWSVVTGAFVDLLFPRHGHGHGRSAVEPLPHPGAEAGSIPTGGVTSGTLEGPAAPTMSTSSHGIALPPVERGAAPGVDPAGMWKLPQLKNNHHQHQHHHQQHQRSDQLPPQHLQVLPALGKQPPTAAAKAAASDAVAAGSPVGHAHPAAVSSAGTAVGFSATGAWSKQVVGTGSKRSMSMDRPRPFGGSTGVSSGAVPALVGEHGSLSPLGMVTTGPLDVRSTARSARFEISDGPGISGVEGD